MANNDNIKEYIQEDQQMGSSPESSPEQNIIQEEILDEQEIAKESSPNSKYSGGLSRLHFWSDWSKKKKIYVFGGGAFGILLALTLSLFFVIRPSKTSSYVKASWYSVVSSSSSIDRAVKSDVNLEGTRDLTKELYTYNEKLGATSFDSKSKSPIIYNSSVTSQYGDLTKSMGEYFSDSAIILAKTDSDISSISDVELDELKTKGTDLKKEVDNFRAKQNLEEELNPNLFALDVYILDVKSKKEEIEKKQ